MVAADLATGGLPGGVAVGYGTQQVALVQALNHQVIALPAGLYQAGVGQIGPAGVGGEAFGQQQQHAVVNLGNFALKDRFWGGGLNKAIAQGELQLFTVGGQVELVAGLKFF